MAIRFDKFTEKAQEAILHAQELVRSAGHPQMETLHLLLALVEQQDGVVPRVLERLGANGSGPNWSGFPASAGAPLRKGCTRARSSARPWKPRRRRPGGSATSS